MKLPRKPSQLIRVALADLAKVERSKKYTVEMDVWHSPYSSGCAVCAASAVMAFTLNVPASEYTNPYDFRFSDSVRKNLLAINHLRKGDVWNALHALGFHDARNDVQLNREIVEYSPETRGQFKREMRKLARDLEAEGL